MGLLQWLTGTPFQDFFGFMMANWWGFFLITLAGAIGLVIVIESREKKPAIKRDLMLIGGLAGIFLFVSLIIPTATGLIQGYQADIHVSMHNPVGVWPKDPDTELRGVSVENIERMGPSTPNFMYKGFGGDQVTGTIKIDCNGKRVDSTGFEANIMEGTSLVKTLKIKNLKPGTCWYKVWVTGQVSSSNAYKKSRFTVP